MLEALSYIENDPLLFTQTLFWLLFGFVLLAYQLIHRQIPIRNLFLLIFSLYFYYLSSGYFFLLLLFSTLLDYVLGHQIYEAKTTQAKKIYVTISIVINLAVLAYFKYTFFFIDSLNTTLNTELVQTDYLSVFANWAMNNNHFDTSSIFLPVGVSFFTFQTISYSIDIYREKLKPVNSILDFAFYVSFFPQLVAGPIVRAHEFIPQIRQPYKLTSIEYGQAIFLIVNGLVKKILVSDYISVNFVDRVFDQPISYSGFENLLAVYGYSIQIYCDFSGYTDVAIGVALLLGFRLPLNFNSPYKATSITDFWRRWHISLSSWLKDYLYISLGGNRKGKKRTYFNLEMTMLLGGLWHGASWRFVIWGALHGLALAIHKIWQGYVPQKAKPSRVYNILMTIITFHFVAFCWIFFRAKDMEHVKNILIQITTDFHAELMGQVLLGYKEVFLIMLFAYFVHYLPVSVKDNIKKTFISLSDLAKAIIISLILLGLFQVYNADSQPFIYFQF
jgi:D-alanyl-lipoteichoic acid acyltransferase DltB (MBOAT superfamily)